MAKNVLTIFEKPVYLSFEPVDPHIFATGVGATAGINLTVLLRGEGVYYGLKDQNVEGIKVGGVAPTSNIGATAAHVWTWIAKQTGAKVYAVREDLDQRGLAKDELTEGIESIASKDVAKLFEENEVVFTS
ncbi:MAG: hypothetical protein ACE5PO_04030 [Candidatus Bathyarchaeia archaeon]